MAQEEDVILPVTYFGHRPDHSTDISTTGMLAVLIPEASKPGLKSRRRGELSIMTRR